MEAVACMLRRNLESLPIDARRIYCLGGGANSRVWLQIKADIAQREMQPVRARESACLGAAILAGVGAGIFAGVDWVAEDREKEAVFVPDFSLRPMADETYRRYIALYGALQQMFRAKTLGKWMPNRMGKRGGKEIAQFGKKRSPRPFLRWAPRHISMARKRLPWRGTLCALRRRRAFP